VEFVKRGSNGLDIQWTPGAGAENYNLGYEVFFAKAQDGTWVRMGSYSQTDWFMDHCIDLPAGTYNKVKVVTRDYTNTLANSEFVGDISLTITGKTGAQPTLTAISTGEVDQWDRTKYSILASGLPADADLILGHREVNSGSGAGSCDTDANGNLTEEEWVKDLSKTEFLVWQCTDISASGTTASMTRTVYGDWTVVEEQKTEEDGSFVTSLAFDSKMRLLLEVNDPDGLYAEYTAALSADGGNSWIDLGDFHARSTGYAVNLSHKELRADTAVQTVYNKVRITAVPVNSTATSATYTTDCTVTITEGIALKPTASFTYSESAGEYLVNITNLPQDAYEGYIYYSDDADYSGWSGHSVSVSGGAIIDDSSKDLASGYSYRLNLYGGIAASEMTLSATNYKSAWTLCIPSEGGDDGEEEAPAASGYSIKLSVESNHLYASFEVPEDADPDALYVFYFYNSEDETVQTGLGGMPADSRQKFSFPAGTYDSYKVLLDEDSSVLGQGKLDKPVVSEAGCFDLSGITMTVGEYNAETDRYVCTFSGLDFTRYSYELETTGHGYYIYKTTANIRAEDLTDDMILTATTTYDVDACYQQESSTPYTITPVFPTAEE